MSLVHLCMKNLRHVLASGLYSLLIFTSQPSFGESKRVERKSMLDQEPDVVYINEYPKLSIELTVIEQAPVFSDKNGKIKLGYLQKGQTVPLEALTERAYRVRGKGLNDGIAGWVAPWAFSAKDPQFVEQLKKFYHRQIRVRELMAKKEIAIGMTTEEVQKVLGTPTKTSMRQTKNGQTGSWEFISYEEQKNYATIRNPKTGEIFRQLVSITKVETGKQIIEFEDNVVSSIQNMTEKQHSSNQTITPPIIFVW